MEAEGLARRIGQPPIVGRDLMRTTTRSIANSGAGPTPRSITPCSPARSATTFGWPLHVGPNFNPRSLRNFPCQANGAEMLRLAACFATEQGIEVCALIHDAVLVCAPLDRLDADVEAMRACMAKASRIVLDGFELRTDVHLVRYPDHYSDPRGTTFLGRVCGCGT